MSYLGCLAQQVAVRRTEGADVGLDVPESLPPRVR
jgi:hypothetical protein